MELEGAKGCFTFLKQLGLTISVFVSNCHRGIAKFACGTVHHKDAFESKQGERLHSNQGLDERDSLPFVLECHINQTRFWRPYPCKVEFLHETCCK